MKEKSPAPRGAGMLCAAIFCAFAFLYLYFFQNDLLAYAQHTLSNGLTTYGDLAGAVIITAVLLLLEIFLSLTLLRHFSFLPALWNLPPALVLASICDVHITAGESRGLFGTTWIWLVAVTLLLCLADGCVKNASVRYRSPLSAFLANLALTCAVILVAVFMGNTNEGVHERLHCERYLIGKNYEGAVDYISRHAVNTPETVMMKAYAMARTGRLGREFFEKNVVNGSDCLFPENASSLLMFPPSEIYKLIGGIPARGMSGRKCLELLRQRGKITPEGREYLYTACLLDRDVDSFAGYYAEDRDTLVSAVPKHYAEAMEIYRYEHDIPPEGDSVGMAAGFARFMAERSGQDNKVLRENGMRDAFGGTYWFYYFFTSSRAFTQSVSSEN